MSEAKNPAKLKLAEADARMTELFNRAVTAVLSERRYQIRRWGKIDFTGEIHEADHEVGGFIMLLEDQLDKARESWCRNPHDRDALARIRNVAAIAIACMEQHGAHIHDHSLVVNRRSNRIIRESDEEQ